MGFGLPILIQDQSLTMGTVIKFLYGVPTNSSIYLDSIFNRDSRSVSKTSRWDIYSMLEAACGRYMGPYKRKRIPDTQSIYTNILYMLHGLMSDINLLWGISLIDTH
jgi:hypothetical protein